MSVGGEAETKLLERAAIRGGVPSCEEGRETILPRRSAIPTPRASSTICDAGTCAINE